MDRDLVFQLLLRDLCACLGFTIVAGVIMLVIAVPTTFMANHPGEFQDLPKRLLWNWFVGTAFTAGSWILLTAMLDLCLQWLTSGQHLLFYPFMVGYFLGWIAGIVAMWRAANSTWSFFSAGCEVLVANFAAGSSRHSRRVCFVGRLSPRRDRA